MKVSALGRVALTMRLQYSTICLHTARMQFHHLQLDVFWSYIRMIQPMNLRTTSQMRRYFQATGCNVRWKTSMQRKRKEDAKKMLTLLIKGDESVQSLYVPFFPLCYPRLTCEKGWYRHDRSAAQSMRRIWFQWPCSIQLPLRMWLTLMQRPCVDQLIGYAVMECPSWCRSWAFCKCCVLVPGITLFPKLFPDIANQVSKEHFGCIRAITRIPKLHATQRRYWPGLHLICQRSRPQY